MEEKKKVWIRGRKGWGSEIKGILTGLGAKSAEVTCEDGDYIYFINHDNEIDCVPGFSTELAQIIMDNYREVELPAEQWKDGDVLICDKWPGLCAVFKKYREDGVFETYLTIDDGGISFNATAPVELYHLASGKEFEVAAKMFYTVNRKLFEVINKKLEKK
jgi:hypothetical protein